MNRKMSPQEPVEKIRKLKQRYKDVLAHMAQGESHEQIAAALRYQSSSVRSMIGEIYRILGVGKGKVQSRTEKHYLVTEAFRLYQQEEKSGADTGHHRDSRSSGFIALKQPGTIIDVRRVMLNKKENPLLKALLEKGYQAEAVIAHPRSHIYTIMVQRRD